MNAAPAPATSGSAPFGRPPTTVQAQVRTGQIISFALVQGVILVAAVMTYLAFGTDVGGGEAAAGAAGPDAAAAGRDPGAPDVVLPLIGVAVALGGGLAAVVIPGTMRRSAIEQFRASGEMVPLPVPADAELSPASARLLAQWFTATLLGQALLEGPAMLNAVLMMVQPHLGYLVPVAVMLGGIAMQTPTVNKAQRFFETAVRR